jgi:hypothetical protein
VGEFCHECGQRRLRAEDRHLRHLLAEALSSLLSLEGRWLRSLGLLAADSGRLSRAWLTGRRRRYLKPFSLFLLVNLIFFVAPPMTDFDLALSDHLGQPVYGDWATEQVRERLDGEGVTFDALAAQYSGASSNVAKSLVVLHVPVLALFLWAAFLGRRWTLAEHVVVAFHLFGFVLLAALILGWIVFPAATVLLGSEPAPALAAGPVLIVAWWRGLRRGYGVGRAHCAALLVMAVLGLAVAHFFYRGAQFALVFGLIR